MGQPQLPQTMKFRTAAFLVQSANRIRTRGKGTKKLFTNRVAVQLETGQWRTSNVHVCNETNAIVFKIPPTEKTLGKEIARWNPTEIGAVSQCEHSLDYLHLPKRQWKERYQFGLNVFVPCLYHQVAFKTQKDRTQFAEHINENRMQPTQMSCMPTEISE